MVQLPTATRVAVDPETVQMVVVVETYETASLELAVAVRASVAVTSCAGIAAQVMVCAVRAVAGRVPLT
jgi:hypothetical protein